LSFVLDARDGELPFAATVEICDMSTYCDGCAPRVNAFGGHSHHAGPLLRLPHVGAVPRGEHLQAPGCQHGQGDDGKDGKHPTPTTPGP
jgi:hypothetical protein